MQSSKFISTLCLALISANVWAGTYTCKPITGTIQPLTPDPACKILQSKSSYFPDTIFYGVAGSCFSGQLQGQLGGNILVTGTSSSGFSVNNLGQLTGSTAIRLYAGAIELGRVYTKDVIFDAEGNTKELLTVVGGSKTFKGGYGNIELSGNTLYQTGSFTGTICTDD
ncbi:MAG: hypothetical protein HOP04_06160 [Methylophilaceae bacterium]|nr:hypothetical protein [Methylophilaceae bacterium]